VKTQTTLHIAPGPNNPVGAVWIDLADGYGIHGTPEPRNVGKTVSHGCIRLTNWDALALAKMVKQRDGGGFRGVRPGCRRHFLLDGKVARACSTLTIEPRSNRRCRRHLSGRHCPARITASTSLTDAMRTPRIGSELKLSRSKMAFASTATKAFEVTMAGRGPHGNLLAIRSSGSRCRFEHTTISPGA